MGNFKPWTRQVTGIGRFHHAYTMLRGRIVDACPHRHRKHATALRCARQMCRVRNAPAPDSVR